MNNRWGVSSWFIHFKALAHGGDTYTRYYVMCKESRVQIGHCSF
ncbi:hypothetical protein R1A30_05490 [Paenibacillus larvae]|nr:hypothetical protein [Paenibacillus larvae]MDV3483777.1 hypothetical protein [Paenibacillus larvae]